MKLSLFTILLLTAFVTNTTAGTVNRGPGTCSATNRCNSPSAPCCSQHGFCGSGPEYCGTGCQSSGSLSSSSCSGSVAGGGATTTPKPPAFSGTCSASNKCPSTTKCCSAFGYCGNSYEYCGAGCSTDGSNKPSSCLPKVNSAYCTSYSRNFSATDRLQVYAIESVTDPLKLPKTAWINYNRNATSYTTNGRGLRLRMWRSANRGFDNRYSGIEAKLASVAYLHYGQVEVVLRAAPHPGVVTGLVLQSDYLDEIDVEWTGARRNQVQSNVFYNATLDYTNAIWHTISKPVDTRYHKYVVNWSPDRIRWYVDNKLVRTARKTDFYDAERKVYRYPNRPMKIYLGLWDGGVQYPNRNTDGTREWAGGYVPWENMKYVDAFVKSIKVKCA